MDSIIYASRCGAALDTDLTRGGGTDDTRALQAALDAAERLGHLTFVLDGPALISAPLKLYGRTTLICPDKGCGLFLKDGSNCCMLRNAHWDVGTIRDEDIQIFGGTFNHNAPGQIHDHGEDMQSFGENPVTSWVIGFEFYGVRGLTLRDVTLRDQRTFGMLLSNWENVTMEDVFIDLRAYVPGQNQDGLHFFGPGRRLTLKNIYGRSGDDFIAVAPDEVDLKSAIEDVLIDGVTLMDADQGIRLLCRGDGRLDRVTVKNVTGTVGGLGFIVNPWFAGQGGHYGDLYFENIDIRTTRRAYDYRPPFLFAVGGEIDSLTLRQVRCRVGEYGVLPVDIGGAYGTGAVPAPDCPTRIGRLSLGDSVIDDRGAAGGPYIAVKARVDELALHDLRVIRPDGAAPTALIDVTADGAIGRLTCRGVDRDGGVGLLTEHGAACVGHIDDPA